MSTFTYLTSEGETSVAYEIGQGTLLVEGETFPCDGRAIWIGGRKIPFWTHQKGDTVSVWLDGEVFTFKAKDLRRREGDHAAAAGSGKVVAQMPGKILTLAVKPGDSVQKGQNLLIMESMKMELALDAPVDGVVDTVAVEVGQLVSQGDLLVGISEA